MDSSDTRAWIEAEDKLTFAKLAQIPGRDRIREKLSAVWNYEKFSPPEKYGDHYFYTRNDGLQNQSVLYVADSLDAAPRVLLDPNKLSSDGTVALKSFVDQRRRQASGLRTFLRRIGLGRVARARRRQRRRTPTTC